MSGAVKSLHLRHPDGLGGGARDWIALTMAAEGLELRLIGGGLPDLGGRTGRLGVSDSDCGSNCPKPIVRIDLFGIGA